jgi:hypothetical protein
LRKRGVLLFGLVGGSFFDIKWQKGFCLTKIA